MSKLASHLVERSERELTLTIRLGRRRPQGRRREELIGLRSASMPLAILSPISDPTYVPMIKISPIGRDSKRSGTKEMGVRRKRRKVSS